MPRKCKAPEMESYYGRGCAHYIF
ncbi:transcriptional regulator, partial [Acinetobacter baumannii]|nr:transcriptional regulator [Acinetobacter baumannii]